MASRSPVVTPILLEITCRKALCMIVLYFVLFILSPLLLTESIARHAEAHICAVDWDMRDGGSHMPEKLR